MPTIKISVIIPVYNTAPYLRECIDSILQQTLSDIEVICVDDGSTDGSLQILREYQQRDSRFVALSQPNSGAGVARNTGLTVAKGKYLCFLDADDFFEPNMLEKGYEKGEECRSEIVMYRFNRYDHQAKRRFDLPHMMNKSKFPSSAVFSVSDMGSNFYFDIYGWTWDKLFLREFIDKWGLRFQDTKIYNDMFFTYSALAVADRISYIEDALMCQRVNREGSITRSVFTNWSYIFTALYGVKHFLIQSERYERFKSDFTTYALHMVLFTYRQTSGDERVAMQIVCSEYGLKTLGINLLEDASLQKKDEVEEARQAFSISRDKLLFSSESSLSNAALQRELAAAKSEVSTLRSEIDAVHMSFTYRVGRFITFVPRKIRGGLRCLKENGVRYTLGRIRAKLSALIGA